MELYSLEFAPSVRKDLRKIDRQVVPKLLSAMEDLRKDPRPASSKKLTNEDLHRIRVGQYRVLYQIEEFRLVVFVVKIGHRKEIYRK